MQTMGHANVRSTLPYQHHGFEGIREAIEERNRAAQKNETAPEHYWTENIGFA